MNKIPLTIIMIIFFLIRKYNDLKVSFFGVPSRSVRPGFPYFRAAALHSSVLLRNASAVLQSLVRKDKVVRFSEHVDNRVLRQQNLAACLPRKNPLSICFALAKSRSVPATQFFFYKYRFGKIKKNAIILPIL